ncbi:hypothetical protein M409DRAFT_20506 [Zasmidium cellare ATCC 36951]|uniref:Uncharacterized protein n=1 Tax=Zasmidium cellare ATCC 36951 TaxID=1080233 RepID=A0A6A6CSZ6_ZASCE|nr:uncharacterized protein M409DRAFT_20506 [Zasmidium cellare ATCC 36951]KAF2169280.1 hypothetical protein M409DRAFT_20506 [Zasmidium cellare ATCC 36951]
MGVVISKTALSPFSLVTGVIGLVSFVFTLGTFFKVVWVNLETMSEAPHEIHGYLTGLRTELLEEKASIRIMRKQAKQYHRSIRKDERESFLGIELDDVTLKTMGDQVRSLIKKFKELEKPFLAPGSEGIGDWKDHRNRRRRDSSVSPYEHSAYASPPEKGQGNGRERGRRIAEDDDDIFWAQRTQYAKFTLRRRFQWLARKAEAQNLFETLSRVQIRRIARQVGGMSWLMHEYGGKTCEMEEVMRRIDERTSRIVGVRRVE